MSSKNYHQQYWQQYKSTKKRVTVSLTPDQYQQLLQRGQTHYPHHTPGQILWLEAQAYQKQRYLPPSRIAAQLDQLALLLRTLHQQIQRLQTSSPYWARLTLFGHLKTQLSRFDQAIAHFVQPYDYQKSRSKE